MRVQRVQAAVIACVIVATIGCGGGLSNNEVRAIHAWLICDDCSSGERGAVWSLGASAVPELSKALVGPSAEQRTIMSNKFDTSFKLGDMATRIPTLSLATYIAVRDSNYRANYQKRAALSLGDIGGDAAQHALDAAIADSVNRQYRPDVIRAIKFARSRIDATTYAGRINPYRVSFGDTVKIIADSGHQFTSQARAVIEDSLFGPDEIPSTIVDDTMIKFPSIAAIGLHMISVTQSPNTPPAKIAMFVDAITDANDRAMPACGNTDIGCMIINAPPIPVGSGTPTFFVVSAGTPAEAMDFFKVQNPSVAVMLVTVHLDWRGNGLLNLGWTRCGTTIPVGHSVQGNASHAVVLSDPIPGSGCWVLQASLASGSGPAYGHLVITSP